MLSFSATISNSWLEGFWEIEVEMPIFVAPSLKTGILALLFSSVLAFTAIVVFDDESVTLADADTTIDWLISNKTNENNLRNNMICFGTK